ncbi:MAG: hypothetical protein HY064_14825 [Bacteroidetes bacterium]|nr:hypothetical protein [Bacteroidota bacterium]
MKYSSRNIFPAILAIALFSCNSSPVKNKPTDNEKKNHEKAGEVKSEKVARLPDVISESSGLVSLDGKTFWTHNDSRGEAIIFNIDSNGNMLRKISLQNEPNLDWEEITKDERGNVYLGDFGNNDCKRRELFVYKFHDPTNLKGDTLDAQDIRFTLPDQHLFPPPSANLNFDFEAMVHLDHSLFLFSKNRSDPSSGYCKMYSIPDSAGEYVAALIDSFYTGSGELKDFAITGAALNSKHDELILISHEKLWLFTHFKGRNFFKGDVAEFSFTKKGLSMEGVCFLNDQEIYLTEERSAPGSGVLFRIEVSDLEKE